MNDAGGSGRRKSAGGRQSAGFNWITPLVFVYLGVICVATERAAVAYVALRNGKTLSIELLLSSSFMGFIHDLQVVSWFEIVLIFCLLGIVLAVIVPAKLARFGRDSRRP